MSVTLSMTADQEQAAEVIGAMLSFNDTIRQAISMGLKVDL